MQNIIFTFTQNPWKFISYIADLETYKWRKTVSREKLVFFSAIVKIIDDYSVFLNQALNAKELLKMNEGERVVRTLFTSIFGNEKGIDVNSLTLAIDAYRWVFLVDQAEELNADELREILNCMDGRLTHFGEFEDNTNDLFDEQLPAYFALIYLLMIFPEILPFINIEECKKIMKKEEDEYDAEEPKQEGGATTTSPNPEASAPSLPAYKFIYLVKQTIENNNLITEGGFPVIDKFTLEFINTLKQHGPT